MESCRFKNLDLIVNQLAAIKFISITSKYNFLVQLLSPTHCSVLKTNIFYWFVMKHVHMELKGFLNNVKAKKVNYY